MTLLLFLCVAASPQIQEMDEAQLNEYVEELSTREPEFAVEPPKTREPLSGPALTARAMVGGLAGFVVALGIVVAISLLEGPGESLRSILLPHDFAGCVQLLGCIVVGVVGGLFTAAVTAARHGMTGALDEVEEVAGDRDD